MPVTRLMTATNEVDYLAPVDALRAWIGLIVCLFVCPVGYGPERVCVCGCVRWGFETRTVV